MFKRTFYIIPLILLILSVSHKVTAQESTPKKAALYSIKKMPFSKESFSDMSPVIVKDGIIFCSDRRYSTFKDRTTFDGRRLYNIWYVQKTDTSKWGSPAILNSSLSTRFNGSTMSIAPDGKTVYFTSDVDQGNLSKKKGIQNHNGIFIADLSGNNLQNIRPFEYNSPDYNLAHPSVSSDGKYLFFVSDKPGGEGKADLYYCEFINSKWSAPVNMGPKVNSSGEEKFPFIHTSGKLYFSSDRPGGNGGLDVYSTSLYYGKWDDPVHLLEPINSKYDDFAFVPTENSSVGYFSSNRDGSDDIFHFTSNMIRKSVCDTLRKNAFCYRYTELNSSKFDTVPFRFQWRFGDGAKAEGISVVHCFNGPGTYINRLDIVNLLTKEVLYNEQTDTLVISPVEQPYISGPNHVMVGQQIKLNADSTNLPGWNITRYYWNFGDELVDEGKEVGKTFTKPGIYNVQLIVTGEAEMGGVAPEKCVFKNIVVSRQP